MSLTDICQTEAHCETKDAVPERYKFLAVHAYEQEKISEGKKILSPYFAKYNSVVMDIYMDHFLAKDWLRYSNAPLAAYSETIYKILTSHKEILPERIQEMLPYMIKQDWLTNYAYFHGMEQIFKGMSRRASFVSHMEDATDILKLHYQAIQDCFDQFFPDLVKVSKEYINK